MSFREKGIWVSWGVGVYDITNLIDKHGSPDTSILLCAGMALDPFWEDEDMAKIHGKPYIPGMMEKCRIGNIKKIEEWRVISSLLETLWSYSVYLDGLFCWKICFPESGCL